jgi:hypothetical protein
MNVPEVYRDRDVRCIQCNTHFTPGSADSNGPAAASPGATVAVAEGESGPDWTRFKGLRTEQAVLIEMCEQARRAGKRSQHAYLAAYANAQTALKRDTWQAASFEWLNARQLLDEITNPRSVEQVQRAREVFRELASDQLLDFARVMEREFREYNRSLPERALPNRAQKISASLRRLVAPQYRDLIVPEVARQVERLADRWSAGDAPPA